mmetsp:Transcript_22973/g.64563  ORF Transcript_22973/g.64563 Transcript_22973/m.64563 type:complete len:345 (+) Transcript_22973:220-1254(+)
MLPPPRQAEQRTPASACHLSRCRCPLQPTPKAPQSRRRLAAFQPASRHLRRLVSQDLGRSLHDGGHPEHARRLQSTTRPSMWPDRGRSNGPPPRRRCRAGRMACRRAAAILRPYARDASTTPRCWRCTLSCRQGEPRGRPRRGLQSNHEAEAHRSKPCPRRHRRRRGETEGPECRPPRTQPVQQQRRTQPARLQLPAEGHKAKSRWPKRRGLPLPSPPPSFGRRNRAPAQGPAQGPSRHHRPRGLRGRRGARASPPNRRTNPPRRPMCRDNFRHRPAAARQNSSLRPALAPLRRLHSAPPSTPALRRPATRLPLRLPSRSVPVEDRARVLGEAVPCARRSRAKA